MNRIEFVIPPDCNENPRLDQYCSAWISGMTRSRLKNSVSVVTVNGKTAKLSRLLKPGDRVALDWTDPEPDDIFAENIPLDILYEDNNVTVINKKQGMVTHPAAGNWTGTLVNALLWHWKTAVLMHATDPPLATDPALPNPSPGIVHRLDKDTSGVIITARNPETEAWLQSRFKKRKVRKVYAAILSGVPRTRSGTVEVNLVRDPRNRKKFTWTGDASRGKHSKTAWYVLKTFGPYSLVLFRLYTGRTHQLRVHSKFLGCPILGDPIYGIKDTVFSDATLMLHAKSLTIHIPGRRERARFDAPIPLRFKKVIRKLREMYR